jgi:hypothetical protein
MHFDTRARHTSRGALSARRPPHASASTLGSGSWRVCTSVLSVSNAEVSIVWLVLNAIDRLNGV